MSEKPRRPDRATQSRKRLPWLPVLLTAGFLVVGAFVGLMLEDLYRERPQVRAKPASEDPSKRASPPSERRVPEVRIDRNGERVPPPTPEDVEPFDLTPENAPPVPEGHIPAWEVNPERPDPRKPAPPKPTPPPDPAKSRPPTKNPGGVDGDRPPR